MQQLAADIQLLGPEDARSMPWKNGAGVTRELAIHPPGAGLDGTPFLWRISIAEVAADGPFSAFPGYDRSIMLVAGQGMQLSVAGEAPVRLAACYRPWRFSGDASTQCHLLSGPVRDFNVMSKRGVIEHRCDVISGGASEAAWRRASQTLFCHCLHGNLIVKIAGIAEWSLNAGQSLWLPASGSGETAQIVLVPNSPHTVAVLVTLQQLAGIG